MSVIFHLSLNYSEKIQSMISISFWEKKKGATKFSW